MEISLRFPQVFNSSSTLSGNWDLMDTNIFRFFKTFLLLYRRCQHRFWADSHGTHTQMVSVGCPSAASYTLVILSSTESPLRGNQLSPVIVYSGAPSRKHTFLRTQRQPAVPCLSSTAKLITHQIKWPIIINLLHSTDVLKETNDFFLVHSYQAHSFIFQNCQYIRLGVYDNR